MISVGIIDSVCNALKIKGLSATTVYNWQDKTDDEQPVRYIWIAEIIGFYREIFAVTVVKTDTESKILYTFQQPTGSYVTYAPIVLENWQDLVMETMQKLPMASPENELLFGNHVMVSMHMSTQDRTSLKLSCYIDIATENYLSPFWKSLRKVVETCYKQHVNDDVKNEIKTYLWGDGLYFLE